MIEVSKNTLSEEQLREITKNYLGIRYRTNKDGSFEAYANAWTLIVDLFKKLFK
jgi:hypothetical protein